MPRKPNTAAKKPETTGGLHKRKEIPDQQTLLCDMTDAEVLETSRMASDLKIEIDAKTAEMKVDAKERKDAIKSLQGRFDELMEKVDTGREHRNVKVLVTHDYEDGLYLAIRQDTGEEIARRPLRENERQQDIPGTTGDQAGDDDSPPPGAAGDGGGDSKD